MYAFVENNPINLLDALGEEIYMIQQNMDLSSGRSSGGSAAGHIRMVSVVRDKNGNIIQVVDVNYDTKGFVISKYNTWDDENKVALEARLKGGYVKVSMVAGSDKEGMTEKFIETADKYRSGKTEGKPGYTGKEWTMFENNCGTAAVRVLNESGMEAPFMPNNGVGFLGDYYGDRPVPRDKEYETVVGMIIKLDEQMYPISEEVVYPSNRFVERHNDKVRAVIAQIRELYKKRRDADYKQKTGIDPSSP